MQRAPIRSRPPLKLRLSPNRRFNAVASAPALAFIALALSACGGSAGQRSGARTPSVRPDPGGSGAAIATTTPAGTPLQVLADASLSTVQGLTRSLPQPAPVISFDVRLSVNSRLSVTIGRTSLTFARGGALPTLRIFGGAAHTLTKPRGWLGDGWRHVELSESRLAVDGRVGRLVGDRASSLILRVLHGSARVRALIISSGADRGWLLLHRLAELHARVPIGTYPEGADLRDAVHDGTRYWTSGFWPGALWQAAALAGAHGSLFAAWALASTLAHIGQETADTHDVGFMYGQSSLAGWEALCRHGVRMPASAAICGRLKRSALAAAGELLKLAGSNPGAGTVPTNSSGSHADTIIDSTMNIGILPWASAVTGERRYAALAAHHADVVAAELVRADGSTAQSVHFDRTTGRVLLIHTHQGLSNTSTWSRGQGWAVYGFAQAAAALHERRLLRIALRAAGYVARHLPARGIPRWDYDAPASAPVDVSAGVITAAGLARLASACAELTGVCTRPARWRNLARRMLAASLSVADEQPPLGFLGSQVLNEHGRGCWCDGGELIFGVSYALQAARELR
ncbi:MAG: hypothetical protein ACYC91_15255 [Solirubrobacteraceae bacterium]